MGSIPLPALHIQPPAPPPNPLEQYGQLLQLRNQMQEAPLRQQALQQQVQEGQIGIQQAQQGQQDQQAFRAAMQDPSMQGKSIGEVADALAQKGAISQNAWQSAMKADTEHKQSIAKLTDTQLTAAKATHDQTQELYNNVMSMPDDQLAQNWPQIAQQFNAIPGQKQQLNPQQPLSKQQLSQFGPVISMGSAYIDQQLARRKQEAQTGEANARANEATVNATLAPAKLANQQANDAVQRRQGAQRISIEQAKLAFEQKKSGLTTDGQPDPNAQAIASGHIVPERMSYLLARNPGIVDAVMRLDPSFDSSKAQAYPAIYKEFTSTKPGTAGGALNAGGTALSHLKELSEMNTNESHIPGTPDYNAYQNKADTVAAELAKFYGDATIPAIAAIKKTLTATLPGNRQAAIQTQAQSMGDKLDSFQQTWENAAPSKAYQAPMPGISQKATAARAALDPKFKAASGGAPSGGGLTVTAPNGKTYSFKDQASADAFKQKAGIQ